MPAAPGSSFGAHFLSASETKSFCSTDLKFWRCLPHRLDLRQLTFCVNLNKILEVIRFLVMTVFLCHPVENTLLLNFCLAMCAVFSTFYEYNVGLITTCTNQIYETDDIFVYADTK